MDKTEQLSSWLKPTLDGVAQNRLYPDTFHIPSEEAKESVRPGDFVKGAFGGDEAQRTERMWVKVTEVHEGLIRGTLDNDPLFLPVKPGALVEMEFRHILAIMKRGAM
jgi:uncharacterized protein YegJ (DUF2314 family)